MFLRVQEGLEGKVPGAVVLVFVTVDPEYDTPKVLKAWTEAWRGRWFALTGSLEECRAVWAGYGIAVLKDPEKAEVGHTVKTVLIDGEGAVRLEYYGIPEARMVLEDIYRLLG
jgi:protein SCO1/2